MFRAAKDTSWALRVTPGLQALGPLFVRGGSFAFSISERYLKVPASTESADSGGHAHPDILTRARGRAAFGGGAPPGDTAVRGFQVYSYRPRVRGDGSGRDAVRAPRCSIQLQSGAARRHPPCHLIKNADQRARTRTCVHMDSVS